ncbi:hypothetical protein TTHERM_00355010 (macronuclear) [Tetrahymena thermophila SB210]|uniref:Uncharacterized protein n=1 Tax=Tetrahymena thermophila (strain SB210) TaxID=312017 RepID=Q22Y70_TETTS|nr:hypothetical protein TTHERM_00355010 [Tetrahymena thermophila SB210]EAR90154.1 hypothetical protein TTHERM_00355010 [Tetrahymena thermophila SB210]|eukprot:XP_001010399.1 hypothetical protein TTHERM_00355010 [Tetrahymena thermophila SB210]
MLRGLFRNKALQKVKIYSREVSLENKIEIEQDFDEENLKQYKNINSQYYFYSLLLQEQSRKANIQDQHFLKVKDQASQILTKQFKIHEDYIAFQFIVDFDLYHEINMVELAKDLQNNKIIIDYKNFVPLSLLLQKIILRSEYQEQQDIIYEKILQFIIQQLKTRVYSINNDDFSNILKAILIIVESNKEDISVQQQKIGFNYLQQKLKDYEEIEELKQSEFLPSILYFAQKISLATNYKFKINYQNYDAFFCNKFKSLDNNQLYFLSNFFILHMKDEPQQVSRFLELVYFNLLSKTKYYRREYLIRKLGIYDFNQPLFQLAKTALTRIFLLNATQKEPKFRKEINLVPAQKLEMAISMLQSVQFKNSPLIEIFLSEIINEISQIYIHIVKLDYSQEYNQLHSLYKQLVQLISLIDKNVIQTNKDVIFLTQVIFNYYTLHNQKFDRIMKCSLIQIVDNVLNNKKMYDLNQEQEKKAKSEDKLSQFLSNKQFKLFLEIFKSDLLKMINGSFQNIELVNQQQVIIPLLKIISELFSDQFKNCENFLAQVTDNIQRINQQNQSYFINFLLDHSQIHPEQVIEVVKRIIDQYGETKVFQGCFMLKSNFLILFMKFINEIENKDKNLKLLQIKLNDLMNFQLKNINEETVLLTIKLIKQSQEADIHLKEIDFLQDVFFRIISDSHKTYSQQKYQEIVSLCLSLNNYNKNFDDGSECYTQTLLEELQEYNNQNYNKFSPEFQKIIEPHVQLEQSNLSKYFDEIKERVQNMQQN